MPQNHGGFGASIELAMHVTVGAKSLKRVLIYDEAGFSRVCSALLEISGCCTDIMAESSSVLTSPEVGVFVTSYPYGALMLEEVQKRKIPAVVLFDNIDEGFVRLVQAYDNMYCMIKPLDYDKFKGLIHKLLSGGTISREDRTIV